MTFEEIKSMVGEMGFPYEYHHFDEAEEAEVPDPPFVLFVLPESDNFPADNIAYAAISELDIELYTDKKDVEAEKAVEAALTRRGFFFQKYESYIESEKMYEVLYEMEVLIE